MKACVQCRQELSNKAVFCSSCGEKQPDELACTKCYYPNEPNSKFCQECGLSLSSANTTRQSEIPPVGINRDPLSKAPSTGITIEFPVSTAASFDFAVAAARRFSTFEQLGDGKKAIFRVTVDPMEIDSTSELVEHLKGWRRRVVYVDGVKTTWDSVFSFSWCYTNKKSSFKPEFYCFGYENEWDLNLWGCIQARMAFREYAEWFTWGRWRNNDGDWEFDKERIRHELEKQLYPFRFCPALSFDRIEAVLSAIPDVVNPKRDKDWKFIEAYEDGLPGTITFRITQHGYTEDVKMKGVGPKGKGAIEGIARKLGLRLA